MDIIDLDTIGSRIRHARQRARLTQDQVADRLGRSKGAVSQWENDIGQPDYAILAAMCNALGVSADFIVRGVDTEFLSPAGVSFARRYEVLSSESRALLDRIFSAEPATNARVEQNYPLPPR